MNTLTTTLTERDSRFILEALYEMYEKWSKINQTSTDEDEQAEYGMNAIVLNMTREKFKEEALKVFGSNITNFSREPFK